MSLLNSVTLTDADVQSFIETFRPYDDDLLHVIESVKVYKNSISGNRVYIDISKGNITKQQIKDICATFPASPDVEIGPIIKHSQRINSLVENSYDSSDVFTFGIEKTDDVTTYRLYCQSGFTREKRRIYEGEQRHILTGSAYKWSTSQHGTDLYFSYANPNEDLVNELKTSMGLSFIPEICKKNLEFNQNDLENPSQVTHIFTSSFREKREAIYFHVPTVYAGKDITSDVYEFTQADLTSYLEKFNETPLAVVAVGKNVDINPVEKTKSEEEFITLYFRHVPTFTA